MADSEKLTALKKAYAEIILNTAKEAAARIMVSERKALRYQQEMIHAKDEALRMLLRLKQMLDSKVREAEIASLNQQTKIEELEAQLQEAEDIVKDLREELGEVQGELEKVTNNRLQSLVEPNLRCDTSTAEEMSQEIRVNIPDSQPELVTSSDMKCATFNRKCEGNKCYPANDSTVDSCCVCNPDFDSIVMRRKEPELYRNGCTQRIRACERNLLDENISLSMQVDDAKNEAAVKVEEIGKEVCETPTLVDVYGVEKNSDVFKAIKEYEESVPSQAVKSFRRKRKRANRYKKRKVPSFRCNPDQVTLTLQASDIVCSKTTPSSVNNNHQSMDSSSKVIENEAQKDQEFSQPPELPSEKLETVTQSGNVEISENDAEVLTDRLESVSQEIAHAGSEVLCNKIDVEAVNISTAISDAKASDLTDGVPSQRADNRFLKYTFRRKRKREPLNSSDCNSSIDNSTLKKRVAEKQNGSVETHKSSLATESSRQSRRLAQVARQLISLSGKKW